MIPLTMMLLALPATMAFTDLPVSEVEPNQTRATATPATLANGGAITGTCRGFAETDQLGADSTRDLWRITLTANPLLIQRHALQVTTSGTQGHTGVVVGVQANGGVVDPASMYSLQSTSISTVPARFCAVYTLGNAAPSFLYRITGSSSSSSPYTVTVTSTTVVPTELTFPCQLVDGPVKITTVGRTSLNTKLFLFNGDTLAPIDGAVNDDTPLTATTSSPQSTLTRTLAPGRYLLAVANGGTVDDRPPPVDDQLATQAIFPLTESPGLLVNGSSTATGNFSFTLTDMFGSHDVTGAKPGAFGVAFFRFTVESRCGRADLGSQGAVACHDGVLNNNDLIVFINAFFQSPPNLVFTDVGTTGGVPGADGVLNNNDWIVFLDEFFGGCAP